MRLNTSCDCFAVFSPSFMAGSAESRAEVDLLESFVMQHWSSEHNATLVMLATGCHLRGQRKCVPIKLF